MKTPKQVKEAAKGLIDQFGGIIVYLGKYQGKDAYTLQSKSDDLCIGFPTFYLFKEGVVTEVSSYDSPDIMKLLV